MMPYVSSPNEYAYAYDPMEFQTIQTPYMQQMNQMFGRNFNADISQLQPITTNNPAITTLTLFKELSGFPNYGNPSGNADILYRGNRGGMDF